MLSEDKISHLSHVILQVVKKSPLVTVQGEDGRVLKEIKKALNEGAIVKGVINGKVKGGLTVMTNGIRAFLPGSLVDVRPVKDTTPYENKEFEFKVIKLDRKRNNVVVSRRAVLEASAGACHSVVLDLFDQWRGLENNGQFRFTPPKGADVLGE